MARISLASQPAASSQQPWNINTREINRLPVFIIESFIFSLTQLSLEALHVVSWLPRVAFVRKQSCCFMGNQERQNGRLSKQKKRAPHHDNETSSIFSSTCVSIWHMKSMIQTIRNKPWSKQHELNSRTQAMQRGLWNAKIVSTRYKAGSANIRISENSANEACRIFYFLATFIFLKLVMVCFIHLLFWE